jgi:hypothetical protein
MAVRASHYTPLHNSLLVGRGSVRVVAMANRRK